MQSFKMIFSGVTILQGVEFPIFPIDFAWALQQSCAACDMVRWPAVDIQVKFYIDHVMGTPPYGELNTRGVAEYSDFGPSERYYLGNGAR